MGNRERAGEGWGVGRRWGSAFNLTRLICLPHLSGFYSLLLARPLSNLFGQANTHDAGRRPEGRSTECQENGKGAPFCRLCTTVFPSAPFQLWSLSFFCFQPVIPGTDTRFSEPLPDRLHVCALLICEPDYKAILKSILENPPTQKKKKTSNEMCI